LFPIYVFGRQLQLGSKWKTWCNGLVVDWSCTKISKCAATSFEICITKYTLK
jgi:hypothetical protein